MAISLKKATDIIVHAPEQDCIVTLSAPGTGKSASAINAAKRMGAIYWPIYAATYEAVDTRGLPTVQDAEEDRRIVQWAEPTCLPLARDAKRYAGKTVLVNMDDLFQAPPPVQRGFVRSFYGDGLQRRIGDFDLYPNIRFMGTGNREQDRAGVYRPETYVNDRITYLEVEPDVDDWVSGAIGGFKAAEQDEQYAELRQRINAEVAKGVPDELIAFVKFQKQCYEFNPDHRSFLSPRSIERLGRFVRALDVAGINGDSLLEVASGTIGEAQAMKYVAFHKLRSELPDIEAILKGEDVTLPPKTEVLFILCTTLLRAAKREHLPAITKFINQVAGLEKSGTPVGVEVSVYMARECLHGAGGKELAALNAQKGFLEWMQRYGKYLM